jgi:hypothetical protein
MARWTRIAAAAAFLVIGAATSGRFVHAQQPAPPPQVQIPAGATALEGVPTVRVDSSAERTARHQLTEAERAANRLKISVRDGKLYWASRDDRPLDLRTSGEFTYLSSDPGHYIKLRRLNDRIAYVEHVEQGPGIVTYWGELRIVLGK